MRGPIPHDAGPELLFLGQDRWILRLAVQSERSLRRPAYHGDADTSSLPLSPLKLERRTLQLVKLRIDAFPQHNKHRSAATRRDTTACDGEHLQSSTHDLAVTQLGLLS